MPIKFRMKLEKPGLIFNASFAGTELMSNQNYKFQQSFATEACLPLDVFVFAFTIRQKLYKSIVYLVWTHKT